MPDRLHGLFADSLPDAWGHVIADRHFASIGLPRERVTVLDRLAFVGTRGMGALTYRPPDEQLGTAFAPDLDLLHDEAERVLGGTSSEVLPQLIAAAGASGGARPKVLVGIDDEGNMIAGAETIPSAYTAYLVKLGSHLDDLETPGLEYAYGQMAHRAGIRVPPARLIQSARARYFAIARFDRAATRRIHMLTGSGLTDAPQSYFAVDYGEMGHLIAKVSASYDEAYEFARRMVFNVLAHNRDDHLKNTAMLMDEDGSWRLSPAYDLTFMAGPGGEHSMLVAGEGRSPTTEHLLKAGEAMGVDRPDMKLIIDQVAVALGEWTAFAAEAGLSPSRQREIATSLDRTRSDVLGR
jgi:serine/threonine-protein kinase HipA